jgi:hypothetical protein
VFARGLAHRRVQGRQRIEPRFGLQGLLGLAAQDRQLLRRWGDAGSVGVNWTLPSASLRSPGCMRKGR